MNVIHGWCSLGFAIALGYGSDLPARAQEPGEIGVHFEPPREIWLEAVGGGLARGATSLEFKLSRGLGVDTGGPTLAHDFWYAHAQIGRVLHDAWGRGHWYGGNFELTGQLFGGLQDHPEGAFLVSLSGGVRYHFATGGRLNPFLAGGLGMAATDIGEPDLGGTFQFCEQIGAGLRYFLSDRRAITLEYFVQHISNASIAEPNHGVNAHFLTLGFAWLF